MYTTLLLYNQATPFGKNSLLQTNYLHFTKANLLLARNLNTTYVINFVGLCNYVPCNLGLFSKGNRISFPQNPNPRFAATVS